ncbi:MAG: hypothetical protein IPO63_17125 [Bacteroidetes bacterium]|nr:hypothetical protein [Bacteroidota bacterium]
MFPLMQILNLAGSVQGGTFGSGLFGGIPTSTRIWNGSLIYAVPNCVSARVPVIAVVNPAPPVTVSPTAATICEGSSVNINVTAGLSDYTNFDWAPAAGLDVTSGTAVVASPSVTTSYIVTATGNIDGCVTSDTAVITVNPAPVFTLSPSSQNLCNGDTAAISVVVTAPVSGNYSVVSIPHTPSAATLTQSAPALR